MGYFFSANLKTKIYPWFEKKKRVVFRLYSSKNNPAPPTIEAQHLCRFNLERIICGLNLHRRVLIPPTDASSSKTHRVGKSEELYLTAFKTEGTCEFIHLHTLWTLLCYQLCNTFYQTLMLFIQNHGRKLLPRPPRNQGQSKQYHQLKQPRNTKREAPLGRSIWTTSGGFSRCFLFAQRFESPHITKMAFCISISSGARFCPLKRLKPLPQQGFQRLHLFQQP